MSYLLMGAAMRGIATIDCQPGSDTIAIWVTSHRGLQAQHVNAVVIEAEIDPNAVEKVRSLTRRSGVLVTDGSVLEGFPVEGEPLTVADVDSLVTATAEQQEAIIGAIGNFKRSTRSGTFKEPAFPRRTDSRDFVPAEATPKARAFATANYLRSAWSAWLQTDDERRRRTVRPGSGQTPWMMPQELNDPEVAPFPPPFAARLVEQALV